MKEQINTEIANGYKMTELGPLPQEWEVVRLGEVCKYKKGVKPKILYDRLESNALPYLTAKYFRENKIEYFVPKEKNNKFIESDEKDIILIWDGSNAGDVFKGLKGVLASTMVKFENDEKIHNEYLYYLLKTKFKLLNSKTTGSTIPHVSKNFLENLIIPLPPLPEQRKIAAILSTVQKAIETEKTLIERTKELKKSMMHKLFTEGIGWLSGAETSQKQTEIGPIPENWELVRLGEVFSIYAGGDISKINYSPIKTQKFIYPIYSNTLENKGLYGFSDTYKFPENSITVTGRGNLGYAIPRYEKYHAIIRLLVLIPKIKLNIKYVSDFINAKIKIHFDGSSIPQLTRPKISFYLLPLPPLPEQHKIADFLSTIDKKIEHHTTKKQKLEELFRTLLHELMTAKVRVNEVELKEVIK